MAPSFTTPTAFKAFEYTNHSDSPLAEIKLNPSASLKPLQPTQVCIKVLSAGVNPLDYKLVIVGPFLLPVPASKENPIRAGFDVAGVVERVGADVSDFKVGDAVFAMAGFECFGTFAEYVNVDAKYVVSKPESLSFDEAAAVPLTALTSFQALFTHGKLSAGQRVLILGGSSATGIFAIQMAKNAGAHVIATTSSRNTALAKSLGADEVVDYTTAKWSDVVAAGSVDLVYDCGVETESWDDAAQKVLKPTTGVFVTLGQIQEPKESPVGATIRPMGVQAGAADLREVSKLFAGGKVKVVIDSVFPLDETLKAVERQMTGHTAGKVVLHVADE
jgi:NADPH:quinone reductase-like Zn-dependent oxidoreductase